MEAIIRKNSFSVIVILCVFFFSCESKTVFNQYQPISKQGWKANNKVHFKFSVSDTISKRNLFINIRNNKEYQFSNLYIISELVFPNKTKVIDTLQYEMTDAKGNFLGTGFSDIKENKLFYKEHKVFPVSGDYQLNISQSMRKNGEVNGIEFLEGITDVGFSIEKLN